jgi:hypothetical protein
MNPTDNSTLKPSLGGIVNWIWMIAAAAQRLRDPPPPVVYDPGNKP